METSRKTLIIVIVLAISLTAFAMAVAFNIGDLGVKLSGAGGPIAAQLYTALNAIPLYISAGGWPSLAVGFLIFVIAWPCLVAYIVWTKDLPYKIQGVTAPSPASTYTNTMSREPPEPERAPSA